MSVLAHSGAALANLDCSALSAPEGLPLRAAGGIRT